MAACSLAISFSFSIRSAPALTLLATDWEGKTVRQIETGPPAAQSTFIPRSDLEAPSGIVRAPDGKLLIGIGVRDIRRFDDKTGADLGVFSTDAATPIGMVFGADAHLYVASRDRGILRYNGSTGASMGVFATAPASDLWWAFDLVFGPQGDLFVTSFDRGYVLRFNGSTGAYLGIFAMLPSQVAGLAFAPNGDLFVAGYSSGVIYRMGGATGTLLGEFGTGLNTPSDVVFGPDGKLYVSSSRQPVIYGLNPRSGNQFATYPSGARSGSDGLLFMSGPVPEIAVYAGEAADAPEIESGQTQPVDLGTTRVGVPVEKNLMVENTGTAPLMVSAVTATGGFAVMVPAAFPVTIAPRATQLVTVRLDATALGEVAGTVAITSNDSDEPTFTFPVAGRIVAPDIVVHDGSTPDAPQLTDGQTTPVEFGKIVQGTPAVREFTIGNSGTATLLVSGVTAPEGYQISNLPVGPFTVATGGTTTFRVSLVAMTVGGQPGSVVILSDDPDEDAFDFPVMGEIFIPDPVANFADPQTRLNRQTGLREQTVQVSNDTTATVPAWQILLTGLPAGVTVKNATEVRPDGTTVVRVSQPLLPHGRLDFILEYASSARLPVAISPQWHAEVILESVVTVPPDGMGTFAIERLVPLVDGGLLLEFASRAGGEYEVQYSNDGAVWKISPVTLQAAGTRCQWIDRGPPRTESPPSLAPNRFYRVREARLPANL